MTILNEDTKSIDSRLAQFNDFAAKNIEDTPLETTETLLGSATGNKIDYFVSDSCCIFSVEKIPPSLTQHVNDQNVRVIIYRLDGRYVSQLNRDGDTDREFLFEFKKELLDSNSWRLKKKPDHIDIPNDLRPTDSWLRKILDPIRVAR